MNSNTRNSIFALLTIIIVFGALYYFSSIVMYVIAGWVISMIGQPVKIFIRDKVKFKKIRIHNTIATIITLALFLMIGVLLVNLFVPVIIQQVNNLAQFDYGEVGRNLGQTFSRTIKSFENIGIVEPGWSPEHELKSLAAEINIPLRLQMFFGSVIGLLGDILIALFSILFISFFFLKEDSLFLGFLQTVSPSKYSSKISNAIDESSKALSNYFSGIALQMITIATVVSIALSVLGVKNALLIGVFAAIINVIPYVGPIIGAFFALFITFSSNLDLQFSSELLSLLGKVALVFAAMQMLDNFLFQPFIFSSSLKAHPLEIFLVILIGGQLAGILGMILAIPTYTVIRVLAKIFGQKFEVLRNLTKD